MNKLSSHLIAIAVVFVAFADTLPAARAQEGGQRAQTSERVMHKTVDIDGLDIFYREAGSPTNPTVLLLHGFPTSSQMFRTLMPQLAGRYYVVAPDYPGYGNGSAPPMDKFDYTFDNIANVMDKFAQALKLERYSLYVMDYGAPIGYRLAVKHPERVQTLIVQNGNAYEEGLGDFWIPFRAYWKDRSEQNAEPLRKGGKMVGTLVILEQWPWLTPWIPGGAIAQNLSKAGPASSSSSHANGGRKMIIISSKNCGLL